MDEAERKERLLKIAVCVIGLCSICVFFGQLIAFKDINIELLNPELYPKRDYNPINVSADELASYTEAKKKEVLSNTDICYNTTVIQVYEKEVIIGDNFYWIYMTRDTSEGKIAFHTMTVEEPPEKRKTRVEVCGHINEYHYYSDIKLVNSRIEKLN